MHHFVNERICATDVTVIFDHLIGGQACVMQKAKCFVIDRLIQK